MFSMDGVQHRIVQNHQAFIGRSDQTPGVHLSAFQPRAPTITEAVCVVLLRDTHLFFFGLSGGEGSQGDEKLDAVAYL